AEELRAVRHGRGDELPDAVREEERTEVRRDRTPVVAEDDRVVGAEGVEQGADVFAERAGVVAAVARRARRRIAAHVRRDDAEAGGGERRHLMPERARLIGEAVEAEDERAGAVVERLEGDVRRVDRDRLHRASARFTW